MNSTCQEPRAVDGSGSCDAAWDSPGSEPAVGDADARRGSGSGASGPGAVAERLSRCGAQVAPGASQRRSGLRTRLRVADSAAAPADLRRDAPPRASLLPAARKTHAKESPSSDPSRGGSGGAPPSRTGSLCAAQDARCALYPMEHAWMLAAAEGDCESVLEFVAADPQLLTRRDFISGYSVLHWLAKKGRDETLVRLLGRAVAADVNVRGSGGLTPLHVASMHRQYAVVKHLVGAFGADVDAMDYGGRRAWQYLAADAPAEMRELLGTWDEERAPDVVVANVNNNNTAAAAIDASARDDVAAALSPFDRSERGGGGGWRFRSLRKLLPSLSFLGNKQ